MNKAASVAIGVGIATAIIVAVIALAQSNPSVIENESPTQPTMIPQPQTSKIKIVASFYPLYEFSKNIAGDNADVSMFIPVGIEPHDWEPSIGD